MAASPLISLVFDVNALVAGKTDEWQLFAQLGRCFLPQAVWEEMQFLCDRSPDPAIEPIAREFTRFFPASGWQVTEIRETHSDLVLPSGGSLSKQARLSLAIGECAYAMSQKHPQRLIVVITNSQPLVSQLQMITMPNLCGITAVALKQWSQSNRAPIAVNQQMLDMRSVSRLTGMSQHNHVMPSQFGLQRKAKLPTASATLDPKSPLPNKDRRTSGSKPTRTKSLPKSFSNLLGLIVLVIIGLFFWRIAQPASFYQFWETTGLPAFPRSKKTPSPASGSH